MDGRPIEPGPGMENMARRLRLPEWSGMGAEVEDGPGDGVVDIVFGTGDDYYDDIEPPGIEQLAHVDWLVANHGALMRDTVLEAALRLWKAHRLHDYDEEEETAPPADLTGMAAHVLPMQIHLTTLAGMDVPYVGVRLSASWNCEHDLGILCRGLETVDVTGDQHIDAFRAAELEVEAGGSPGTGLLHDKDGYEVF